MPYRLLGFHNCKYGYTDLDQVKSVVQGYADAGIPLDTQWVDIDYMQDYRDFTWDAVAFPISEVIAAEHFTYTFQVPTYAVLKVAAFTVKVVFV